LEAQARDLSVMDALWPDTDHPLYRDALARVDDRVPGAGDPACPIPPEHGEVVRAYAALHALSPGGLAPAPLLAGLAEHFGACCVAAHDAQGVAA
jgi:hypothetical protein